MKTIIAHFQNSKEGAEVHAQFLSQFLPISIEWTSRGLKFTEWEVDSFKYTDEFRWKEVVQLIAAERGDDVTFDENGEVVILTL